MKFYKDRQDVAGAKCTADGVRCKGSICRWLMLSAVLIFLGCTHSDHSLVIVSVSGLTPEVSVISATSTLNGRQSVNQFSDRLSPFGLSLSESAKGLLVLSIDALGTDRCIVAQGSGQVQVNGESRVEIRIDLSPLPVKRCWGDGGTDAGQQRPDIAVPSDLAAVPPSCGTLTFEDLFGIISYPANPQVSRPSPVNVNGVTFISSANSVVWNMNIPDGPFPTDYLAIWTYDTGATIKFPRPIVKLSFDAGQRAVASAGTFDLWANGTKVGSFTAGTMMGAPRSYLFNLPSPSDTIVIANTGGSTGLLGLDNFSYLTTNCP